MPCSIMSKPEVQEENKNASISTHLKCISGSSKSFVSKRLCMKKKQHKSLILFPDYRVSPKCCRLLREGLQQIVHSCSHTCVSQNGRCNFSSAEDRMLRTICKYILVNNRKKSFGDDHLIRLLQIFVQRSTLFLFSFFMIYFILFGSNNKSLPKILCFF